MLQPSKCIITLCISEAMNSDQNMCLNQFVIVSTDVATTSADMMGVENPAEYQQTNKGIARVFG